MSAPRIAGHAEQRVDAGDQLGDEAAGDLRGRLLDRRPDIFQVGLIETELVDRVGDRRVDRVTDLGCLVDHALRGRDHDDGTDGEQAEDDHAGGQAGLEAVPPSFPTRGGRPRPERPRISGEHDLAHRGQREDHDDERHHDPRSSRPRSRAWGPGPEPVIASASSMRPSVLCAISCQTPRATGGSGRPWRQAIPHRIT